MVAPRESSPPRLSGADGVDVAAREVLRAALQRLGQTTRDAAAGDAEGVHQLRVTLRRLRATLALFGPVLGTPASLEKDLAWLGRQIGGVRDIDVIAVALAHRSRRLPDAWEDSLTPLAEDLSQERAIAQAALVAALRSPRTIRAFSRVMEVSRHTAQAVRPLSLATRAPELLAPLLRRVRTAARTAAADPTPETLHALRVRAKRLRYAAEMLGSLDPALPRLARRLARVQEVLGRHQDAVTQVAWLTRYAGRDDAPSRTLVAVGMLIAALERRIRRVRRRVPRRLTKLVRQVPRRLGAVRAPEEEGRRLRLVHAAGA
jgi:CHAD domain-containing protein